MINICSLPFHREQISMRYASQLYRIEFICRSGVGHYSPAEGSFWSDFHTNMFLHETLVTLFTNKVLTCT